MVFIEDSESVTEIPPMTRKLTYTLSSSGVTRNEMISPETVSKSQPTVRNSKEGADNNVEKNIEKEKVKNQYLFFC